MKPNPRPLLHASHVPENCDNIRKLLTEGDEALQKNDMVNAEKKYQEVLDADCRNFRANFRMAQIHHRKHMHAAALEYIMNAKFACNDKPMIWKLAGIIHLEDYLENKADREVLSRAITGFTRGKNLGVEHFDIQMEQCCRCLLAISYYLRAEVGDAEKAHSEIGEQIDWDSLPAVVRKLEPVIRAFRALADGGSSGLDEARAQHQAARDLPEVHAPDGIPTLKGKYFRSLLNKLDYEINEAEINASE